MVEHFAMQMRVERRLWVMILYKVYSAAKDFCQFYLHLITRKDVGGVARELECGVPLMCFRPAWIENLVKSMTRDEARDVSGVVSWGKYLHLRTRFRSFL